MSFKGEMIYEKNIKIHLFYLLSQRYYVEILLYCPTLARCGMAASPLEALFLITVK